MLASRIFTKKTILNVRTKSINFKSNVLNTIRPVSIETKRTILTDASLINKIRFSNEGNVVNENLNGTLRLIKMNPSNSNNDLYLNTETLALLEKNLSTFLNSTVCECVVVNSVIEGETLSKGINPQYLKQLVQLDQENRVSESIKLLKHPYNIAAELLKANKPVVFIYNGKSENSMNSLGNFASLKISTEFTQWSMNQLQNGILPDLASTAILPKLTTVGGTSGQLGIYLLMTGDTLSGEDAYLSGITSHYIPYDAVDDAISRLSDCNLYKNKAYLKLEALTLNTEILRKNTKRGVVDPDAIEFLKKENYKIYNRIALEQYSQALEEFAQPINSINRNYQYKYSKEALQVIEYGFDILRPENLNNELVHKEIINRLSKIVASSTEGQFNITWNDTHKNFAKQTLAKLSNVSDGLLQITARMIVKNSQLDDLKKVLANDQLVLAEFISNNALLQNIQVNDENIVPDEKTLSLLKVGERKKNQAGLSEPVGFNRNMFKLGLIKESDLKKLLKTEAFKKISSKEELLQKIEALTTYAGKTSNQRFLKSLIFNRCLEEKNGSLYWNNIKEKVVVNETAAPIEQIEEVSELETEKDELESTLELFEIGKDSEK
ncbi:hypothetical protein QEN19_001028 [Hanseniaspora menglaensis]